MAEVILKALGPHPPSRYGREVKHRCLPGLSRKLLSVLLETVGLHAFFSCVDGPTGISICACGSVVEQHATLAHCSPTPRCSELLGPHRPQQL